MSNHTLRWLAAGVAIGVAAALAVELIRRWRGDDAGTAPAETEPAETAAAETAATPAPTVDTVQATL